MKLYNIIIIFSLAMLTFSSCKKDDAQPTPGTVGINFEHVWGADASEFALNKELTHPTLGEKMTFTTFKYYLGEVEGDAFGKIYEYFLGKFALAEGQKGGVFYTPTSIVKLIVEIIEPYHGKIFDPACGSGGMFVQSAQSVSRHQKRAAEELTVFGTEKANDTVKLAKMNLAVHGLSGDIRESNTYYEDPHKALGKFDFVMANPPFTVSGVDKERVKDDPRFPFGIPTTDNANYLWIQHFYTALNERGRAGFVMANSAGDARGTELEIRKKLIQTGSVDVIVSVGSNFFYTVTLPCTLWFFDRAKTKGERKDEVLFIDARAPTGRPAGRSATSSPSRSSSWPTSCGCGAARRWRPRREARRCSGSSFRKGGIWTSPGCARWLVAMMACNPPGCNTP